MDMFKSATKLVLVIMVLSLCAGLFTGVIDPKDFKDAMLMVLAFYFGGKAATSTTSNPLG
jgi:hypothetical protein